MDENNENNISHIILICFFCVLNILGRPWLVDDNTKSNDLALILSFLVSFFI